MVSNISPSNCQLISKIARNAFQKTLNLKEVFSSENWDANKAIRCWLGIAAQYFEMMTLWSIYQTNEYEKQKLISTPKTIDTIYYEDMLIGQKLIQYKSDFQSMANALPHLDAFNYKLNCEHGANFIDDSKIAKFQE